MEYMGLIASAMRADALLPPLLIFYMISLCDVFLGLTGIQFPRRVSCTNEIPCDFSVLEVDRSIRFFNNDAADLAVVYHRKLAVNERAGVRTKRCAYQVHDCSLKTVRILVPQGLAVRLDPDNLTVIVYSDY